MMDIEKSARRTRLRMAGKELMDSAEGCSRDMLGRKLLYEVTRRK